MRLNILICLLFISCSETKQNQNLTIDGIYEAYIDKKINNVQNKNLIKFADTLIESDEGVTWKGLKCYYNNKLIGTLETHWNDSLYIRRIVIIDNSIKTNNKIGVGDNFGSIKQFFDTIVPSQPDGYFALKDKRKKYITYFFNTNLTPKLDSLGRDDFSQIPSNAKIEYIIFDSLVGSAK